MKYYLIIVSFLIFYVSCDHGVNPEASVADLQGISGTIHYFNWPDSSVLFDLRIVVFNNYPPSNIFSEISQGKATVFPPLGSPDNLPFFTDSTNYTMVLNTGTFEYVVVAHQFGTDILNDWQAVGQYDTTSYDTIPTKIEIFPDSLLKNINIIVDFDSLPGQPF